MSSVQLLSCVRLFATPWTAAHQASLSVTNSQSVLKLMPTESVMPSNHLILCHPLLLLPSMFPNISVLSVRRYKSIGLKPLHAPWLQHTLPPSSVFIHSPSHLVLWASVFLRPALASMCSLLQCLAFPFLLCLYTFAHRPLERISGRKNFLWIYIMLSCQSQWER